MPVQFDQERIQFLRGLLVALASSGQVIHYDEVRRMCRLNNTQVGEYLDAARQTLEVGEPDFCALVVNDGGWPGDGFGELANWPSQLREVHRYWRDRRRFDNPEFEMEWGRLPSLPRPLSDR